MDLHVELRVVPTATGVGVRLALMDSATGRAVYLKTMNRLDYARFACAVSNSMVHIANSMVDLHTEAETDAARIIASVMLANR